MTVIPRTIL